jgi:tetratricopeptide (TPR) repeat protein
LGYLHRALPILETLLKSEPGNNDLLLYAALTEADLGKIPSRVSPQPDSILWLRRGMADLTSLVARDPANMTNLLESIKVQEWLSLSLARDGREQEALALAQDAIGKTRSLADDPGATLESRRELPRAYAAMAAACVALGKHDEARKWYRAATVEWDKLASKGLNSPDDEDEIADAGKGGSSGASITRARK